MNPTVAQIYRAMFSRCTTADIPLPTTTIAMHYTITRDDRVSMVQEPLKLLKKSRRKVYKKHTHLL